MTTRGPFYTCLVASEVDLFIAYFEHAELSLVSSSSTRMASTSNENMQMMHDALDKHTRDMKLYFTEQLAIVVKPINEDIA